MARWREIYLKWLHTFGFVLTLVPSGCSLQKVGQLYSLCVKMSEKPTPGCYRKGQRGRACVHLSKFVVESGEQEELEMKKMLLT